MAPDYPEESCRALSVTGWRKQVLVNWIETYVELTGEDAAEFLWLLELEENRGIQEMELTWLEKAEVKGEARGEARAMEKALERMRRAVLQGIAQRFGPVPERIQERIETTDSVDALAEVVERLPMLTSVEDLAIGDSR